MGRYLNPPDCTKEHWLRENATCIGRRAPARLPEDQIVICHVDNGWMTAAALCDSEEELRRFRRHQDPRPKLWFLADPKFASLFQ